MLAITYAIIGLTLSISTYIYLKLSTHKTRRTRIAHHGCEPPPKYPSSETSSLLKARTEATKAGTLLDLYMQHFALYGKTWSEEFQGQTIINTIEPRNIQSVTAIAFNDWSKASNTHFTPFTGKGIFSMSGAEWKHARTLIKPTFSRAELGDVEMVERHVDRLMSLIPRNGDMIDMQGPVKRLFLDTATEFLFGESIDSQVEGDPNNSNALLQAFDDALTGTGKRRLLSPWKRFLHNYDKSWKNAIGIVHAYIDTHVQKALKLTAINDSKITHQDEKKRYILLFEMANQIRDPIALRFQILNVFIPARGTTALMISNALFHLARNPHIWTSLREQSVALGEKRLSFEVLKGSELRLFKYVLFETLRFQGPSGWTFRTAERDTILPVGGGISGKSPILVPKGGVVALNLEGLHHDRDIWGEDVNTFNPHRWENVDIKRWQWEFVPFLGGPRICPAMQQVLTQGIYLLVRLTREFEMIENRDPVLEYVGLVKTMTESKNGVKVGFRV